MPDKEGAEEKTTKDVVTKRQKQLMNKEEYVQEMPDDVKNIMMKGLRKGAGEFSKGGDPKNIIKKGVKSTIKNVIKSKSVQNFLNNEYIPEEGYDVARDQGRVKPSKDKKDATTMPRSKEMEKTRKVNKGPSALERVKADIEKRYGKGAIMNVNKEELDLTQVAESFGGDIVEMTRITGDNYKKFIKNIKKGKAPIGDIENPDSDYDYNKLSGKEKEEYMNIKKEVEASKNQKPKVTGDTTPKQGNILTGGGDPLKSKQKPGGGRPRGSRTKIKTSPGQKTLPLGKVTTKTPRKRISKSGEVLTDLRTVKRKPKSIATPKQMASVQKDIAKRAQKKLATTVAKKQAANVAVKQVAKTAAKKTIAKGVGKGVGKFAAKRIPGVGSVISGAEAFGRAAAGDYVGAAIAGAEGIASLIPGLGTAASAGLGAINLGRDVKKATRAAGVVKQAVKLKRAKKSGAIRTPKQIKKAFQKSPKFVSNPPKPSGVPFPVKNPSKGLKRALGTTTTGRIVRGVGVGAGLKTVGGKVLRGASAAVPNLDQGVVGRRTAG